MRRLPVFLLLLATSTACHSGEKACPAIGLSEGISLDIPPEVAADVTRVSLELCWAGDCVTESAPGGEHVFIPTRGLPTAPVRTTVTFDDGKPQVLDVTPVITYPAGEDCGGGVPGAKLVVTSGGEVRQGP
ncbi:hypothetical protein DL991_03185 [Amycolatopsis sp. WAC 01375]|uniref:hypothetical protein n=1 Tax=unclassified Amycolatopsis TaxID=2618356 RepID=UPI000F7A84DF|nr:MULTISPECIES: hypothetical protein [unclassified Amycolatopsis]RSM83434.1 hypothetical protein DL991_03185 [Amycolatopsis sp. WAC 01375]RSN35553.1 hypothetical protein DL990_05000 [Amycolatopsis sp. WAC 01416]